MFKLIWFKWRKHRYGKQTTVSVDNPNPTRRLRNKWPWLKLIGVVCFIVKTYSVPELNYISRFLESEFQCSLLEGMLGAVVRNIICLFSEPVCYCMM